MTSRLFRLAKISRWASLTAVLVVLAPSTVFATHFELARLANEIELISAQLAENLRYTRHYGCVRQRAVTLRREASQLADTLGRNRSNSRIRSQFKDVRRGYERLEQAFFIADRRNRVPRLYREINVLSNIFTYLSEEFYYAGLGEQNYGPAYNSPHSGLSIIGSRYSTSRYSDSRYSGSRYSSSSYSGSRDIGSRRGSLPDYGRREEGSRSNGRIAPHPERAVPPVFRGNNSGVVSSRQKAGEGRGKSGLSGNNDRAGRENSERGSRGVHSTAPFEHSSRVLERQARQNTARRELENQARPNRSSLVPRQSSRGTNELRGRGGRGALSESRRRNQ
ncbi:MAG: hypothetical protein ACKVIB_06605 [Pseudomonadales bacterium]|jgi:hypothetical protein